MLATLAQERVRPTGFLVSKSSTEFPTLVRHIAAEGHKVAHPRWSHQMASKLNSSRRRTSLIAVLRRMKQGSTASRP
ncbi:polysaccharide deacetylase family protein [Bradyrhizobium sp. WSM3983]|uniref:polysaccharide deacetylase family protein n=1 Tax=Bradyrhizobium sp. WSM3983 TaxID=1038867 RepID=UPI003527607E